MRRAVVSQCAGLAPWQVGKMGLKGVEGLIVERGPPGGGGGKGGGGRGAGKGKGW